MKSIPRAVLSLLAAALPLGCGSADRARSGGPEKRTVRMDFRRVAASHSVEACLRGLERSYRENPDGAIAFDATSRVRIAVPKGRGREPYHAHLFHRGPTKDLLDTVFEQGKDGALEIDLGSAGEPELLILTSASGRLKKEGGGVEAPIPPYALGFEFVKRKDLSHLLSLQPQRYEIRTPQGGAVLVADPINRSDILVTVVAPRRTSSGSSGTRIFTTSRPIRT